MSENELNKQEQLKAALKRLKNNPGVKRDEWKNRYLVSAKLGSVTWKAFHEFCKEHNYNYNAGLIRLLVDSPQLTPYFKENA